MSENRLLEASGVRANDEQNKQQMLLLLCTWGHNPRFLFQKLCYTNTVHCHCVCVCVCVLVLIPSLLLCFVAVHTSQPGPSEGLKIINLCRGE